MSFNINQFNKFNKLGFIINVGLN